MEFSVKVLWVCNMAIPEIARQLNMEVSNKEGWLSGVAHAVMENKRDYPIEIMIAFPVSKEFCQGETGICSTVVEIDGVPVKCFGFYEDTARAEAYDEKLEDEMRVIFDLARPDIVHCFGTEYPHTLAACRAFPRKEKILVGLQGLCSLLAKAYLADLPEGIVRSKTLRDILRKDSLLQQREKFELRGENEKKVVALAGNITGRTDWDRRESTKWNPKAEYFKLNENLRGEFYGPIWKKENCIPHSIFLSQGDYPLKGLHYMLLALPIILEKYPDTKVYVAGNSLVAYDTLKEKLKISGYGKYLRGIMERNGIKERVIFLGRLTAEQMRDQYLASNLFVCCSSLENSPNSLGEAMMLGMPCVSANVGGVPSIFFGGEDGIVYDGFKIKENNGRNFEKEDDIELENVSKRLAYAVLEMWSDEVKMQEYCQNARNHARKTHDKVANFEKMMEIYAKIHEKDGADRD